MWATLPTQFALLFFNILHPPLNVPALGACVITILCDDDELMLNIVSVVP
jgi:SulP family sulfate permease